MKKFPLWKREKRAQIYPNQWMAIRVLEVDNLGNPRLGEILAHHSNHEDLYRKIQSIPLKGKLYIFYNEVDTQEEVAIVV